MSEPRVRKFHGNIACSAKKKRNTALRAILAVILLAPAFLVAGAFADGSPARASTPTFDQYPVPTPDSSPGSIAAGPNGDLWFTELAANKVGEITPDGVVTEYAVPTPDSAPSFITAGPGGDMWFTEFAAGKIAKITPAGAITEYPIPAFEPGNITVGPDGNLWVIAPGEMDKVTPAGSVTVYQIPLPHKEGGLTVGPDGNIWFGNGLGNEVTKMAVNGQVLDTYELPGDNNWPEDITTGPDGNLWVTEANSHEIAKITTSGTITEYAVPTSGSPWFMTAGSDGSLWFTVYTGPGESSSNEIGQITTAGQVTMYPIPTSSAANVGPFGIATGLDGNIWFTEVWANKIGRLNLATPSSLLESLASLVARDIQNGGSLRLITNAESQLSAGNVRAACAQVDAFQRQLSGLQHAGEVSAYTAAILSGMAGEVLTALDC